MFADTRGKRVLFVAHCILNQNAISDGTADFPAAHAEIVRAALDAGVGIVQMPCPELYGLGLDRGNVLGAESPVTVENTRIRREMQKPEALARLLVLVEQTAFQIAEYLRHGFTVCGVVGMNRSPCCGVDTTSDGGRELAGQGVFIAALQETLAAMGLTVPVIGIKASDDGTNRVRSLLRTL